MMLLLFFSSPSTNATDFNKLANLAAQRYGERARVNVVELQQILNGLASASEAEKLNAINKFFNQKIKYFEADINIWGQSDYWATPLESMGRQRGDCEDYSIAKYLFLRELGIPDEKIGRAHV